MSLNLNNNLSRKGTKYSIFSHLSHPKTRTIACPQAVQLIKVQEVYPFNYSFRISLSDSEALFLSCFLFVKAAEWKAPIIMK